MKKLIPRQSARNYKIDSPESLTILEQSLIAGEQTTKREVIVCCGSGCMSSGSEYVREAFERESKNPDLEDEMTVKKTGCRGFCVRGPIVVVGPENIFYQKVSKDDVQEIVSETLLENRVVERLLYEDLATGKKYIN